MATHRKTQPPRVLRRRGPILRTPVALKLIVALVALTVGASLWQGTRDFRLAWEQIDEFKNREGVGLACELAALLPLFWLQTQPDGTAVEAGAAEQERGRLAVEDNLRHIAATRKGILDIVVFPADRENVFHASLSGRGSFLWERGTQLRVDFAQAAGVTIFEGRRGQTPVRSFTVDMLRQGRTAGRIVVYLSAEDIAMAGKRLWNETLRNVVLGFVAATGVSILLGALLTRPLRALVNDMRAVSTGNLDRRSNVTSADEVGDLARTFNHMVESLKEVQERRVSQKAMEKELGIARHIQKGLLPAHLPVLRTWDIAAHWTPAREVGGDYYDFIDLGDGTWGAAVADVSGKGIPAALIMSMTRCLLRLATHAGQGPSGTVALVDGVLAPDLKGGMFVSMVYLSFAEESGDVRLVRAGHNPPLIVRANGAGTEACRVPGVGLGVRAGFGRQSHEEAALALAPGDVLALYSDGITEAMNPRKEEYGEARFAADLAACAARTAAEISAYVVERIAAWRGSADQSDDITLVVLKRKN